MSPGLFVLPFKGIIQQVLDGAGSKTPQKAPVPSALVPLPWSGSMHFFPQANEQHFICSTQCPSVWHQSGTFVSQVILSWGHTPGFSAREQCPHSHPLRVSALPAPPPWQRGIVTFPQPSPLPSILSACLAYLMGWVCLSPLVAHLD